ncbi:uncharacterized protein LOC106459424 [Limulus polyphemus]|uniref:Uncharacterized protein LOC106459424 n=1 Tax=Limulus polyphemus TaxID=6850 RepID=A0ABM1SDB9_LIMPO|nr:uncharacterized protein LOC106459424 [Limulus polyphemus]
MAIIQMLYVLPMLLGRTFDARNDRVGVDLFPNDVVKNHERIDRPQFTSSFKMVDNSKDAKDFLDVSGDLSLKIKTGKLEVKGTGNYLKDTTSIGKNVEILTKLDYRTSIFSIPSNAQPLKDWQTRYRKEDLGTHYVKSVTYGGSLVASLQFIAKDDSNLEEIKGNINVAIQGNSAFDLVAEGKLEKFQKVQFQEKNYWKEDDSKFYALQTSPAPQWPALSLYVCICLLTGQYKDQLDSLDLTTRF